MILFSCLYGISLGQYCQKGLAKNRAFGKKIKRGDGHIGGLSIEGGFKTSAHYDHCHCK